MKYSWKELSDTHHICVDSNTGKILCEVNKDKDLFWYTLRAEMRDEKYETLDHIKRAAEVSLNREYIFDEIGKKLILLFVVIILYINIQYIIIQ